MGIGKNGSSKRSRNLAGFSRFSKKTGKNANQIQEIGPSSRHIAPPTLLNPPLIKPYPQDTVLGTWAKKHSRRKGRQIWQPLLFR